MTNFEKALEAAAIFYWQDKIAKFFPISTGPTDLEKDMFRQGANWSRKFTVDEVVNYLRNIQAFGGSLGFAADIEQHFNKQKEGK